MVKKILAVMLAASMVLGLAACGSKPATPDNAGSDTPVVEDVADDSNDDAATPDASGDKVHISIWRYCENVGATNVDEVNAVAAACNEWLANKGSNVEIEIHDVVASEFPDKANLAVANNEVNLLWTSYWIPTVDTVSLYNAGAVYDLTDLVPGTMLWDAMQEGIWEASKFDGHVYYVPVYKECYEGYDLKCSAAYADKYGWDLDSIHHLKDIEPMLADLKADGVRYPFVSPGLYFMRMNLDTFEYVYSSNALLGIDRESDTVVSPIATDMYLDWVTMMGSWAEKGYISEDDVAKTIASNVLQTNDWGFTTWTDVPDSENNSESRDGIDEYMIYDLTNKYIMSNTTLGSSYCVTASSTEEQAKAAIEFLGYLYTDSSLADIYTFGIEGVDHTVTEDGRIQMVEDPKYYHSPWESTSVSALSLMVGEPDNKVEEYESKNGSALTSQGAGFRFDTTPVEAQWTACVNLTSQYGEPLERGAYFPSVVEAGVKEYLDALYAAGYQDIIDECNKQYEAWKQTK